MPAGSPAELAALAARDRDIERLLRETDDIRTAFRESFLKSGRSQLPPEAITAFQTAPEKRSAAQKKLVARFTKQLDAELSEAMTDDARRKLADHQGAIDSLRAATPDLPRGYFMHEPSPKPPATHVLLRGNPQRPGEQVSPAVPAVAAKHPPQLSARRIAALLDECERLCRILDKSVSTAQGRRKRRRRSDSSNADADADSSPDNQ